MNCYKREDFGALHIKSFLTLTIFLEAVWKLIGMMETCNNTANKREGKNRICGPVGSADKKRWVGSNLHG